MTKILQQSYSANGYQNNERLHQALFRKNTSKLKGINPRSEYQRDRDRIIHSSAFRRLKHKTQVFVSPSNEHYRTRLTHTLEVAQIARSIAFALGVDSDLTEAIALAHDLGHPPFGHSGEDTLNQLTLEQRAKLNSNNKSGFNHNDQTFRIVTKLETGYINHPGLNLTIDCLEGIIKHNGYLTTETIEKYYNIAKFYKNEKDKLPFLLEDNPSLEAQIAALSDDIAYNHHDLEDGIFSKIISLQQVLAKLDFISELVSVIKHDYKNYSISESQMVKEIKRRLISISISDVIFNTQKNIEKYGIESLSQVHKAKVELVSHSSDYKLVMKKLRDFLYENLYLNTKLLPEKEYGQTIIDKLFNYFIKNPNNLEPNLSKQSLDVIIDRVIDHIASLTDIQAKKDLESL